MLTGVCTHSFTSLNIFCCMLFWAFRRTYTFSKDLNHSFIKALKIILAIFEQKITLSKTTPQKHMKTMMMTKDCPSKPSLYAKTYNDILSLLYDQCNDWTNIWWCCAFHKCYLFIINVFRLLQFVIAIIMRIDF